MIKIIKLKNGQEIIGDIIAREIDISNGYVYKINEPMYIDSLEGGMKLRDGLLITTDTELNFSGADILTMCEPTNLLVIFYHKTIEYANKYGRPYALSQIKEAITDLEEMMQQDEKRKKKRLINIIHSSNSVNTFH